METLTKSQKIGLGVAFNEASLLGVEVLPLQSVCAITLSLLTLPESGPAPADARLQALLHPVGRVSGSLRMGRWDDPRAEVKSFALSELPAIVESFGGQPLYGWEFFDLEERMFRHWSKRLSLDWHGDATAMRHNLYLFQEDSGPERVLNLRIWFRDIAFNAPDGTVVDIDTIIRGGKRWWAGLESGDQRTDGYGIYPMRGKRP